MMLNLHDMATQNATQLTAQADQVAPPGSEAATFRQQVKDHAGVALCVRHAVLAKWLADGQYLNCYELAGRRAEDSGRTSDQELRDILRSWYGKRQAFDAAVDGAQHFHYGLLHWRGAAPCQYGPVAVRLDADDDVVYLPRDSLSYLDSSLTIDAAALAADLAPAAQRGDLAVVKHGTEVATAAAPARLLVDSAAGYCEGILSQPVGCARIAVVWLGRREWNQLLDWMFEAELGLPLDPEVAVELSGFRAWKAVYSRRGLKVELDDEH
ncbi:MAG: hypothetical protein IT204_24210 [Fimbriimonadaceae bacterium]|nr:hypothetical protein [Fimbriimonadaceae bacterium]